MITAYIILLTAIILWKLYFVWKRGAKAYRHYISEYVSFYEYLVGNGASLKEARYPFIKYALVRALKPLMNQWRLFLLLVVVGFLLLLIS